MADFILVADDNRDSADMLVKLIDHLGHEAKAVYTGRDAIVEAANQLYDIVFIDLDMPEVDGFNAAYSIRHQPGGLEVALVAITGLTEEVAKQRAFDSGFDLFITKPVTVESLREFLGLMHVEPV